jgi:phosphoribosyl 1,2-cyclic phosphodiesterase
VFINLGNNNTVRSREIILIVDQNTIISSSIMEEMIESKRGTKKIIGSREFAKSVVITTDVIYFSSLSVPTLKKRSSIFTLINKSNLISENNSENNIL